MVAWSRSVNTSNECKHTGVVVLFMGPYLVAPHIRRIDIRLGRIEDHAMYCRLFAVFINLYVGIQPSCLIDGEDVPVACIFVEGITVDVIWWLLRSQDEDGPCSGIGAWGES